jgi:hypothetical protein
LARRGAPLPTPGLSLNDSKLRPVAGRLLGPTFSEDNRALAKRQTLAGILTDVSTVRLHHRLHLVEDVAAPLKSAPADAGGGKGHGPANRQKRISARVARGEATKSHGKCNLRDRRPY